MIFWTIVLVIFCALLAGLFGIAIVTKVLMLLRARRLSRAWPRVNPPQTHQVLRTLLGTMQNQSLQTPDYPPPPTVIACLANDEPAPVYYAITRGTLADRRRENQLPSWGLLWTAIDHRLPGLMVLPESVGMDFEVENEQFNRRFQVRTPTGRRMKQQWPSFSRYASALLHPRMIEALLDLPRGAALIVREDIIAIRITAITRASVIEDLVAPLRRIVGQIPRLVWEEYGGQEAYDPAAET